jgi:hypothetical protein
MNGSIAELLPLPWRSSALAHAGRLGALLHQPAECGITTWLDPADVLHFPATDSTACAP